MRHAAPLLLALALAAPAAAAPRTLVLKPDETTVTFFLKATGHDVDGAFELDHGRIVFDEESGAASGEVAFSAKTGTTFHAKRDKTMHRKVLKSAENPTISFVPDRYEGHLEQGAESEVNLHGTIHLLGQPHPFTLPATVSADGETVHLKTTFSVPYIDWGLENPSLLFLRVAKEVEVSVEADGHLTEAVAQAAR